jgi:spore coat-associated protein N
MRKHLSKKVLLSLAAVGTAASIAGLGTFATFTSTTSATHSVSSGTVAISLGAPGAVTNRLSVSATNVVPGDTIQRTVDLISSTSTDGLGSVVLTTTAPTTSSLLNTDATLGLQMLIDECSVPWTEAGSSPAFTYTCTGGTTNAALTTGAVIRSAATLSGLSVLTAPGTSHLRIKLTLPATADNTFQTLSSVIDYSFLATQRTATNR